MDAPSTRLRYPDHSRLLEYRDDRGVHPVRTPDDWARRRRDILMGVVEAMGPLPTVSLPLDLRYESAEQVEGVVRHRISYQVEPGDRVPAYLLIPELLQKKAPAALCLHQTVPIGKKEPVGLGTQKTMQYARELALRGYICLVPDYPSFGDYPYDFSKSRRPSGSIKAVFNNVRGIDLLLSLPDVEQRHVAAIGHSLGGHNAIFTAVFDERIAAVVSSCGFTAFGKYYGGNIKGWTGPRYMPRLATYRSWRELPFDFHELIAALAPRPFLAIAPLRDDNFEVSGVRDVMTAAGRVYKIFAAEDRLAARYPDAAHDFPDVERKGAYDWLDRMFGRLPASP